MGSTLMLNSKVKLGCNICDKCCVNRGDIKITPISVIEISKFLNISKKEFVEQYTEGVTNQPLELVIKGVGPKKRCVLNDEKNYKCKVHPVKPMQCVTFPLIPLDVERDIFYNQDTCVCENKKEMKVVDWLNGKDGIYLKYKKVYIKWIDMVEKIQEKWSSLDQTTRNSIFDILFFNYKEDESNIKRSVLKNIKAAKRMAKV